MDYIGVDIYDECWISSAPAYLTGVPKQGYWYSALNWTTGDGAEYKGQFYQALHNVASGGLSPDQAPSNWELLVNQIEVRTKF